MAMVQERATAACSRLQDDLQRCEIRVAFSRERTTSRSRQPSHSTRSPEQTRWFIVRDFAAMHFLAAVQEDSVVGLSARGRDDDLRDRVQRKVYCVAAIGALPKAVLKPHRTFGLLVRLRENN